MKYWKGIVAAKDAKNEKLEERVQSLSEDNESLYKECSDKDGEINSLRDSVASKDTKIEELVAENNFLKEEADSFQTKRLADAFEKAGVEYEGDSKRWLHVTAFMLLLAFAVALLCFHYSIVYSINWEGRLYLLPVSGVVVYALYFCARQYSLYRNLCIDMKHRQVLAQSYYNILRSTEDEEIRPILASKVVEFITTPPHTKEDKMGTPLEIITDIASKGMSK